MSKRILILHTSIGLGHKSMAENIGKHLELAGFEVKVTDILEVQAGKLVDLGTAVHKWINTKIPWLWSWLYLSKGFASLTMPFRIPLAGRNYSRTLELINEFKPDIVLTDQAAPSAVLSYLKQKGLYKGIFGIAFSDYHLHPYWLYSPSQFYLVNIIEQKKAMVKLGIPADLIHICGMTLKPEAPVDATEVRKRLGLKEGVKTVLLSGGSLGYGLTDTFITQLIRKLHNEFNGQFQIIVVCGKDKNIYEKFQKIGDRRLIVLGFYKPMAELYSVSDIFVGKPGGLSVAESLLHRLPIVITHWLPGQEELNVTYLNDHKLTLPIILDKDKQEKLFVQIVEELQTGEFKRSLDARASEWSYLINIDPNLIKSYIEKVIETNK